MRRTGLLRGTEAGTKLGKHCGRFGYGTKVIGVDSKREVRRKRGDMTGGGGSGDSSMYIRRAVTEGGYHRIIVVAESA
jgi:hypothetical protein